MFYSFLIKLHIIRSSGAHSILNLFRADGPQSELMLLKIEEKFPVSFEQRVTGTVSFKVG